MNLIIIDFQNDFVSGALSVPGASIALKSIFNFIEKNEEQIDNVMFTVDWHPFNHCSFKEYGGQWPAHCVEYTEGSSIYSELFELCRKRFFCSVFPKGKDPNKEEYASSILVHDAVICGLVGDFCVLETLKNMVANGYAPKVFYDGIASIDNGVKLRKFIKENDLVCVNTNNVSYKLC